MFLIKGGTFGWGSGAEIFKGWLTPWDKGTCHLTTPSME